MITLNHILPDRNGIDFTSRFKENKKKISRKHHNKKSIIIS